MADHPLGNVTGPPEPPQPMSVAEGEWLPSEVETCRIINVNIDDWSVDCVSEYANKRYFDIQVMSPYFHFANGEGIYAQPEVGALCWVCVPSGGRHAAPFVLGFQSAFDEDFDNFRGGRQTLNPGDVMLRTRDENFVLLRRGGVLQLGATPVCQTMYVPIGNILRHFCEQYELNTFGGSVLWTNTRDDATTDGDVGATLKLEAKEKVNSPGNDVEATIGFHGDGEAIRLDLSIFESGAEGAEVKINLQMTNEGAVSWDIEQSWSLVAKEDILLQSKEGSFTADAEEDVTMSSSSGNALVKASQGEAVLNGKSRAVAKSAAQVVLDAPVVHCGAGATSPLVKGDQLVVFMTTLIGQLAALASPVSGNPIVAAPAIATMTAQLSSLLSTTSFTK